MESICTKALKLFIIMLLCVPFNGRQEYRGGRDLRERLDRMRSPLHNSPGRGDTKARYSSHGDSPRSLGKRIDRNNRKRKQLDGHSDYSGRMSDGTEDQIKDRRQTSSDTKMRIDEQLRELNSEIKMLESDKRQLEVYLEDKVKEADTLTLKIHELEMQVSKEKEEGKRFTTKIKKFIKAHNRHLRLQDELKRSHAQLLKLGEQLDLDAAGPGNADDSKINTTSDDIIGGYALSPLNEDHMNSSPRRKRPRATLEARDISNRVYPSGDRAEIGKMRVEKLSRRSENRDQVSNSRKPEADRDAYSGRGPWHMKTSPGEEQTCLLIYSVR
ncbi:Zinc finger CCCH domain-containing protein 40 [Sesamum alatum]|uniref:Zinc finger CCCH domain-containing protein 40 n=1 Tax=Sesamum alatum TaxID=300844 RepID=A0AAE2CWS4_9LAMI|nr:Zinc finger CCCH domain-containing protein 40 [Sesamum alatum]